MHVNNHYSSRKMTLAKDYKDTKMVFTGAYLDKSMAYQKLIVTRVKDTPSRSGNSQTGRIKDFLPLIPSLTCLLSPRKV